MTDLKPTAIFWWDEKTNQVHVSSMNVSDGDPQPDQIARRVAEDLSSSPDQIHESDLKTVFDYESSSSRELTKAVDMFLAKLSASELDLVANEGEPPKQPRLN